MSYNDYLEAGGTDEALVMFLDGFFTGGESRTRRIICENNEERNQILYAILDLSSLLLGFSISQYENMDWNSIYYDNSIKEIHTGKFSEYDGDTDDMISTSSIYQLIISDLTTELVELPDIMTLFEPAC